MRRGAFEGQIPRLGEDVSNLDSMDTRKQSERFLILMLCITGSIIVMQLIYAHRLQETTASLTRRVLEQNGVMDIHAELEQLRRWRAEVPGQVKAEVAASFQGGLTSFASSARVADLEAEVAEKTAEIAKLEVAASDMQIAYRRLTVEKLNFENMAAKDDKWGSMDLDKRAMEKAKEVMAQCGQKAGKMISLPGVEIWKGYSCSASDAEVEAYLSYTPRGVCPDDWLFVQKMAFLDNCFALPKRRCLNRTPNKAVEPVPFPESLFSQRGLADAGVRWELHQCKSFACLDQRVVGDCRNCFNMALEWNRWGRRKAGLDIDKVMELKPRGLRLGLDVGGGTGSFAAHMALRNVTVVTTAYNIETVGGKGGGLPYMEAIALRGLLPMHLPHKARLPFFDNTLDLLHSMNSIKYLPMLEYEELLFEWDRVLRPGGVMWFEMFYAPVAEMPLYVSTIELLGYKKLWWNITRKVDAAEALGPHLYLNCLIEKPARGDGDARFLT